VRRAIDANGVVLALGLVLAAGAGAPLRGQAAAESHRKESPPPELPADDLARDMDAFVTATREALGVPPGLAIAVVHGDEVIYERGFGHRDVEEALPVDAETIFYIASSTKSFTALLAALLAERGVLDLDAPVASYLGVAFETPAGVPLITVRDLLTHESGIENEGLVFRTAYSGQHTSDVLLGLLARSEIGGREFDYTNVGYVITSLIIDRVTGESWKDLLAREIFAPLGMNRTTAYVSGAGGWKVATPYVGAPDGFQRVEFGKSDDTMHAAGGLLTTVGDMAKWLRVQLNEGRLDGRQVFPADAIRESHRSQAGVDAEFYRFHRIGYGLGWYVADYEGDTLLHHFGSFPGFRSHVSFMPEHGIGVAVLANDDGHGFFVPDLVATYAYDRLLGKAGLSVKYASALEKMGQEILERKERMRVDIEERRRRRFRLTLPRTAYAGTYVNEEIGEAVVEEKDGGLVVRLGRLTATAEPYTEDDTVRVELVPGQGAVMKFHLAGDGRVDGLEIFDRTWQRDGDATAEGGR
jgi:CubicO group peptidase (beta-lactamase class C family)